MTDILLSNLDYLNPKQIQSFKKANIITVKDLLMNYPSKFDDYTIKKFSEVVANELVTVAGVVQSKVSLKTINNKLTLMTFYVDIEGRRIRVSIFNRQFLKTKIFYGVYVRLTGKFNESLKGFTASEINFQELSNDITPIYNIKGITNNKLLEIKEKVFGEFGSLIEENLPLDLLKKYDLVSKYDALRFINIPSDLDEVKLAIKRIKFEELFVYQMKIKYLLYMRKNHPRGVRLNYDREKVDQFIKSLPYVLTTDQSQAVEDILNDMNSSYKMNRLLQGEVGSGKTVVAAICLYAVVTAGYQGAIMVPTEVLASQHLQSFSSLFKSTDVRLDKLSGTVGIKDKRVILSKLINHEIDIIIGTHSLFSKDVEYPKLGLVVTDEEHRFGVKQRVSIVGKGHLIDHLKMSATPIPRTLAISVLGESDISFIKTLPGNRKEPITKYLTYKDTTYVISHIREELKSNHQVYIVVPMIEESAVMELENANDVFDKVQKEFKGSAKVGLIHSKLKNPEKEQVMQDFTNNDIQILVSTSVIEVGVNVINATTMVILDAERFGIAQLHQMRGRVRRSDAQAYCFLMSDTTGEVAINRLNLVEENTDGFILAEEDLLIRGPGDYFGEKQSGNIMFQMADIVLDKELFLIANEEAEIVIESDKLFNDDDYQALKQIIHENYEKNKEMLD